MKQFLKKVLMAFLRVKARKVLHSDATIIGVTGSMGKTTAKNAIVHVLKQKYNVLTNSGGFNTEIGILLTLVQETESGFASPWKWLKILWRVFWKKLSIPDIIVLEYGVDAPGDMVKLLRIARPHIAVVTKIGPMHLAKGQFESIAQICEEKAKLPHNIAGNGLVILNYDDPQVEKMAKEAIAPIVSYGQSSAPTVTVRNVLQKKDGISFELEEDGAFVPFFVPFLGTYHTEVLLPSILIGKHFGISYSMSSALLKTFSPPPGRGRIFEGVNESIIWDSSYNSGLTATKAALKTLQSITAKKKIALLGNMNELGDLSAEFHKELGVAAALHADEIFFVGENFEHFAEGVGNKKPLQRFQDAEEAGNYFLRHLHAGDFLLVKGSQNNVFLERAVKKVLQHPKDAEFLCRQDKAWKEK